MAGKDKKVKRGRADSSDDGAPQDKKSRLQSFDEARRKEIRETNRLAARECRARKKRLMSELEKTVGNLTAEHSALTKQNRELTIRLETLQRTVGPPPGRIGGMVPGAAGLPGIAGMGQQNMLLGGAGAPQIGLLAGLNASPAFQIQAQAQAQLSKQFQQGNLVQFVGGGAAPPAAPQLQLKHLHHYGADGTSSDPQGTSTSAANAGDPPIKQQQQGDFSSFSGQAAV